MNGENGVHATVDSAIKREGILPPAATCTDLENIMLRDIIQS